MATTSSIHAQSTNVSSDIMTSPHLSPENSTRANAASVRRSNDSGHHDKDEDSSTQPVNILPCLEHTMPPVIPRRGPSSPSSGPSEDDAAVFDADPINRRSSPDTSHSSRSPERPLLYSAGVSDCEPSSFSDHDLVSSIPPSIYTSDSDTPFPYHSNRAPAYTPTARRRPGFRNTSSIRALQLSTTPPRQQSDTWHGSPHSPRCKRPPSLTSRNGTPRSQNGTPRSRYTHSLSPSKKPKLRKEYPLVLLHVTLLPVVLPYPYDVMADILPHWVMDRYKTLGEKVDRTVLERGILLPHPREEYEGLEEGVLEALELERPRILKCGHFYGPDNEEMEDEDGDEQETQERGEEVTNTWDENLQEANLPRDVKIKREPGVVETQEFIAEEESEDDVQDCCADCGRQVRDGRYGDVGRGRKDRYTIKVYAANGLMRAGAWAAAWREMERVDVEIEPWLAAGMRRALEERWTELKRIEEEQAERKRLNHEEERMRGEEEAKRWREEIRAMNMEETGRRRSEVVEGLPRLVVEDVNGDELELDMDPRLDAGDEVFESHQQRRLKEIYGDEHPIAATRDPLVQVSATSTPGTRVTKQGQIPLQTLLKNYLILLAQDTRNVVIFVLTLSVLALSMTSMSKPVHSLSQTATGNPDAPHPVINVPSSTGAVASAISDVGPTATAIISAGQVSDSPISHNAAAKASLSRSTEQAKTRESYPDKIGCPARDEGPSSGDRPPIDTE